MKHSLLFPFALAALLTACNGQNSQPSAAPAAHPETTENLTAADTSHLLMNEDQFWKLIDKSGSMAGYDYQAQISTLKTVLLELEPADIVKFNNTFTALLDTSYDYKLWGASYVINGGCSDDCFDYFRQYLIGHGKAKFYQTYKDPDSCAGWIKSEMEDNWEGLQYAAMDAYKQKTGKDIPITYQPKYELKGKPFDEANVMQQYPNLAKKFMTGN